MWVFKPALRPVFLAEHLGDQLLPAVAALGHGRVGVGLLQGADVRVLLKVGVVGAGRGREEVPPGPGPVGRLDHVGVDQNAAQALDAEALDEAHAAHVGRQVVDLGRALHGPDGVFPLAQIHAKAFDAGDPLVPFRQRLLVDGPDAGEALIVKYRTREPAIKPPAPVITIKSSFFRTVVAVGLLLKMYSFLTNEVTLPCGLTKNTRISFQITAR